MHLRDMAVEQGGGLKFQDNEKRLKVIFCAIFLDILVFMVINNLHISCADYLQVMIIDEIVLKTKYVL